MKFFWRFIVLASALVFVAGQPAPAAQKSGDRREHRIDEPVFHGQAYVFEAGLKNAQTLVLVHGLGNDGARVWDSLVPRLAKDYHVVGFDLPGFGRSTQANALYSPANYVAFIKTVAEKYARGKFVLVGHSMGGAIALRYAAMFPEDVERLVVVDAAGILHRMSYSQYLSHLGINLLPVFYPRQKDDLGRIAGAALGKLERLNLEPEVIVSSAALRQALLQGSPTKIAGLALVLDDFSRVAPAVAHPTLIVWGRKDNLAPLRTGKMLAAIMPDARLRVLEAGHVPMIDDPKGFLSVMNAFLREPPPPAPPLPPATGEAGQSLDREEAREAQCDGQGGMVFEGRFSRLFIHDCSNVRIRDAEVAYLRVVNSSVDIENSRIGGSGETGLSADLARVVMTGGGIEGRVAVVAGKSHLDFAGVTLKGSEAAVRAPLESTAVFSVCRADSPHTQGALHGYYLISLSKPL